MSGLFSDINFYKELTPNDIHIPNPNNSSQLQIKCNHKKRGLCMIYSDTCYHCISMGPVFKKVANMIDIN